MDELNAAHFDQCVLEKIELARAATYSYEDYLRNLTQIGHSVAVSGAATDTIVESRSLRGSVARFEVAVNVQQTLLNLDTDSKLETVSRNVLAVEKAEEFAGDSRLTTALNVAAASFTRRH